MRRFVELIVRYKEYATALVLITASLIMISGSSNRQLRSFRTISVGIVASVQSALSWVPNPFALERENHALRQLNKDLAIQAMELRDAAVRVEKLQAMLEFKQKSPLKLLSAKVVGKATIQLRNTATLNVGSGDGVKEGMPVITESGLIGRVAGLSEHYSIVQLLINVDTRVAARTLNGRNEGIITWDPSGALLLKSVPVALQQKAGDTVVTSSQSVLFPENLVIGTITSVSEERGTLFDRIVVTPAVDFSTLEEAFVVLYSPVQERLELERRYIEGTAKGESGGGSR